MARRDISYPAIGDDKKILEEARELVQRLGFKVAMPSQVQWSDTWYGDHGTRVFIPSDVVFAIVDVLVLPGRMRGRLSSEEWKPILASSLIYFYSAQKRFLKEAFLRQVLPFLFLLVVIDYLVLHIYPYLALPVTFVSFLGIIAWGITQAKPFERQAWLMADREASKFVGKENLLRVLEKIDSMGLRDIERLKHGKITAHFADRPNISRRITNLRRWVPAEVRVSDENRLS